MERVTPNAREGGTVVALAIALGVAAPACTRAELGAIAAEGDSAPEHAAPEHAAPGEPGKAEAASVPENAAAQGDVPRASLEEVAAAQAEASLAPLETSEGLTRLDLEGFEPALTAAPRGATQPRPLVVALHGLGDRPEKACASWTKVTRAYSFVVCPTGLPLKDTGLYTLREGPELRAEVDAAIAAVRARFGAYVAEGPVLLAGFSLGSVRTVAELENHGAFSPRAALVEGAYERLLGDFPDHFATSGGKRLLLGCAQAVCEQAYQRALKAFARAGIEVRIVYSAKEAHGMDADTTRVVRDAWPWLVRDDPRWAGYRR